MKKTLLLLLLPALALAQQTREFSLVTYNSLRYSPTNIDARHPHFRTIMNDLQPDLLVLEELSGQSAAQMFADSVLNKDSATYSFASFSDGPDLDIALFFKTAKFSEVFNATHATQLRDIYQFGVLPAGAADTLYIFGVHLKASSGSTNESRREDEVAVLRNVTNQLPDSTNFLVCGDFNIYGSSEPAYQDLLADTPGDMGHFVDKIILSGSWNNSNYAQYHTQSPRTTQFNGGAHGGMDDRFDLILISEALDAPGGIDYVAGSMKTYGNDGQHYNKAIIDAPANTAVSSAIATALHQASDHLPVVARFSYQLQNTSSLKEAAPKGVGLYYHEGQPVLQNLQSRPLEVSIYSLNGQLLQQFECSHTQPLNLKRGIFILEAHPLKEPERRFRSKLRGGKI